MYTSVSNDNKKLPSITDTSLFVRNLKVSNHVISESDYTKVYNELENKPIQRDTLGEITDYNEAVEMIGGCLEWQDGPDSYLTKIITRNGDVVDVGDYLGFIAYYPEIDVILFEGGHTSDVAYSLRTGEGREIVGNPDTYYVSDNKEFRISGYFPGQECYTYYVQQKDDESYRNLFEINSYLFPNSDICYIREGFWLLDNEFYYQMVNSMDFNKVNYFKITIEPYKRMSVPSKEYLIEEGRAGNFSLGFNIDELKSKYYMNYDYRYREEGEQEDLYIIPSLGIFFSSGYNEIWIIDNRFSTKKMIGTGSTIKELKQAYPDVRLFYTYISQMFYAESAVLGKVQFIFDVRDFKNKNKDLMQGDSVVLDESDFKLDTQIDRIRIY